VQEALLDGEQLSDSDVASLVAECIMQLQTDYNRWRNGNPTIPTNADGKPTCSQVGSTPSRTQLVRLRSMYRKEAMIYIVARMFTR
jgi:hypothetical protein